LFLGGIASIVLLFIGNDVAWKSRKFASVDEFKAVQKAWAKWGLIFFIIVILIAGVLSVLGVFAAGKAVESFDMNNMDNWEQMESPDFMNEDMGDFEWEDDNSFGN